MSEKSEGLESQLTQRQSTLSVLRSMTEHPGWRMHVEALKEQSNLRKGEVLLKPLKSLSEMPMQEFTKGEISGLALAEVSPYARMEVLESEIRVIKIQLEKENEISKASAREFVSRVDE